MTQIVPFEFEGSAIRVVDIDGAPWFVGKDVAERQGCRCRQCHGLHA
jgi:prophage antirepressor-like protein